MTKIEINEAFVKIPLDFWKNRDRMQGMFRLGSSAQRIWISMAERAGRFYRLRESGQVTGNLKTISLSLAYFQESLKIPSLKIREAFRRFLELRLIREIQVGGRTVYAVTPAQNGNNGERIQAVSGTGVKS